MISAPPADGCDFLAAARVGRRAGAANGHGSLCALTKLSQANHPLPSSRGTLCASAVGFWRRSPAAGGCPSVLLALALLTRLKGGFMTASTALKQIADSDLSRPVPHSGTDEIGRMLQHLEDMRSNLSHAVGNVKTGAGPLPAPRPRWPRARWTCPRAPSNRPAPWKKRLRPRKSSPARCSKTRTTQRTGQRIGGEARRMAQNGGRSSGTMVAPWPRSTSRRKRLWTSSA